MITTDFCTVEVLKWCKISGRHYKHLLLHVEIVSSFSTKMVFDSSDESMEKHQVLLDLVLFNYSQWFVNAQVLYMA